jgi:hypothetical protein
MIQLGGVSPENPAVTKLDHGLNRIFSFLVPTLPRGTSPVPLRGVYTVSVRKFQGPSRPPAPGPSDKRGGKWIWLRPWTPVSVPAKICLQIPFAS